MASILISDFDETLHERLKEAAAAHHRTTEEEARAVLAAAVSRPLSTTPRENLAEAARRLFGPEHGVELDIPPRGSGPGRSPPDFSDGY